MSPNDAASLDSLPPQKRDSRGDNQETQHVRETNPAAPRERDPLVERPDFHDQDGAAAKDKRRTNGSPHDSSLPGHSAYGGLSWLVDLAIFAGPDESVRRVAGGEPVLVLTRPCDHADPQFVGVLNFRPGI